MVLLSTPRAKVIEVQVKTAVQPIYICKTKVPKPHLVVRRVAYTMGGSGTGFGTTPVKVLSATQPRNHPGLGPNGRQ